MKKYWEEGVVRNVVVTDEPEMAVPPQSLLEFDTKFELLRWKAQAITF